MLQRDVSKVEGHKPEGSLSEFPAFHRTKYNASHSEPSSHPHSAFNIVAGVMEMGNIVPGVGIEPTFLAFRASEPTITRHRLC